ncbi:MAG: DUF2927 domain-containing protein, partial [Rhodobacteraceae bacterium]|nr:DUF2927 domain-containing protein [Paracoccaceae bacterium]
GQEHKMTGQKASGLSSLLLGAAVAILLTGCQRASPDMAQPVSEPVTTFLPDPETQTAITHYRQIEQSRRAEGLLRIDGGGADTPFSARDLAANFIAITFFDEFADKSGRLVAGGSQVRLHRWTRPLRVAIAFGASVPPEQQARNRTEIEAYIARLSRLTGLAAEMTDLHTNFLILIANPPERRAARSRIMGFAPGTSAAALDSALHMAPSTYCTVFGYSPGTSSFYDRSLAVLRAELPPLMLSACIHEELAQGLGLVNDSPHARPSIFNDNAEFALLTRQDELLLKMLYDPRLKPGMTLEEARPVVEMIAAELLPDGV